MAPFKTRAIVFKTAPYREYDKRVILLTRDYGRVTVVAPAAQKSRRRFSSLDSLTLISAHYTEKAGAGMPWLQESMSIDVFSILKKDIQKIAYGSYFLEIGAEVMREKEPSPALFDDLLFFLKALEKTNREEWLARFFEARLLPRIGYSPMLRQCVKCEVIPATAGIQQFSISLGGIICARCGKGERAISSTALLFLNRMISEPKLFPLNEKVSAELKNLLPSFLFHYLGKEPRSFSFLDKHLSFAND